MRANPTGSKGRPVARQRCVTLIPAYSVRQSVALREPALDAPVSAQLADKISSLLRVSKESKARGLCSQNCSQSHVPNRVSSCRSKRRRSESNRRIEVLQTSALPLGYGANQLLRLELKLGLTVTEGSDVAGTLPLPELCH